MIMTDLKNRYDFVLVFDVQDGNPNGDPDAGNMPRTDPETGAGLITDVCLKRKVRNYVQLSRGGEAGYDIFIKEKAILNNEIAKAYETEEVKEADKKNKEKLAKDWMCANYYDIRTFGAVMTTGKNAGQVRGPVQMAFARSQDKINFLEHTITRMAVADEKDAEKERTMGRKFTVPYGLYVAHGFVSPQLANQTGFTEEDLALFFKALVDMFEYDRSAARGLMAARKLIVFKHADALGNAPAWKLFDLVKVAKKAGVEVPRSYDDYEITIDKAACPANVEIEEKI